MEADGDSYVVARREFLHTQGAEEYLAKTCDKRAIAQACLAWLRKGEVLEALMCDEDKWVYFPQGDPQTTLYERYLSAISNKLLSKDVADKIDDDSLVGFLMERLLKNFRVDAWARYLREQGEKRADPWKKDFAQRVIDEEPLTWHRIALECLGTIRTRDQIRPLIAVAFGSPDPINRARAISYLAHFSDRYAVGKTIPAVDGKGYFGVGGRGPAIHNWEKQDILFTKAEKQLIWEALLVAMVADPSTKVQKEAAINIRSFRNGSSIDVIEGAVVLDIDQCIEQLGTAIELIRNDEVRKSAEDGLESLKFLRDVHNRPQPAADQESPHEGGTGAKGNNLNK
jgi:hypothetical protein